MRFVVYVGSSTMLATGVVIRALHQRSNFYSASVYLAQSNACLMILTNSVLLGLCTVMLCLQKLFYGPLRPIEIEQLYEKAWFAITETCLAMTIFRDEAGAWFLVMFVCLLMGKVWGWIGEGRVEILEQQPPVDPRLFHTRLSLSLIVSSLFDILLLRYSVQTVLLQARPNMMVMFAFEFAVLTVTSLSTSTRYVLTLHEHSVIRSQINGRRAQIAQERRLRQGTTSNPDNSASFTLLDGEVGRYTNVDATAIDVPGWEEKGRWIFYLDLATDFAKLVLYLTFFCVLCMFYGMPIHIIRDVAITIRSFYKRVNDFLRYRQATRDMNVRYPDATENDISEEDVCIICREDMRPWQSTDDHGLGAMGPNVNDNTTEDLNRARFSNNETSTPLPDERLRPKKLPCGHVLHFACLRSWLERQQICPTCRAPVLAPIQGTPGILNARQPNQIHPPAQPIPAQLGNQEPAIRQNVFNIGPFRLAFGGRRGLAQVADPAVQAIDQQPVLTPVEPQHVGNSSRLFRETLANNQRTTSNFTPNNIQIQLQQIEQRLIRDIINVRAHADQLFLVRELQGELARLRVSQLTSGATTNAVYQAVENSDIANTQFSNFHQPAYTQNFVLTQQQSAHPRHHHDVQASISVPNGWSILPLQRLPIETGISLRADPSQEMIMNPSNRNFVTSVPRSNLSSVEGHEEVRPLDNPSDQPTILGNNMPELIDSVIQQGPSLYHEEPNERLTANPSFGNDIHMQSSAIQSSSPLNLRESGQDSQQDNKDASQLSTVPPGQNLDVQNREDSPIGEAIRSRTSNNVRADNDDEGVSSLACSSQIKGKGKEATVQDYKENVD